MGVVMASNQRVATDGRVTVRDGDLLLRETNHRCANDLQLVVSLLGLQSSRAVSEETRQALADAADRVAVLARARGAFNRELRLSLEETLQQVCGALNAQAEPRSILIAMRAEQEARGLTSEQITTVALVVNELVTNSIKHAFGEGKAGRISIAIGRTAGNDVTVTIDDDGLPLPDDIHVGGLGLGLAKRLMASINGLFIPPTKGSKVFQLRVPVASA